MKGNENQTNQLELQTQYSPFNETSIFNNDLEIVKKTKHFITNDDYMLREIAGEFVLIPIGDGVEQFNGMLSLNETFKYLWDQFSQPHTIEEVILKTQEEFEDTNDQIEKDICKFVDESLYYGLMKVEG